MAKKAAPKAKGKSPSKKAAPPRVASSLPSTGRPRPKAKALAVAIQDYGSGINAEVAERICELIEETPKGLAHICGRDGLVTARTFHRWVDSSFALRQRYARAKELQAELLVFEAINIADTPQQGVKKKTDADGGVEVIEGDMIEHRRLQVDVRKWLAGKLHPKKWGDKIEVENTGETTHTIRFTRG